MKGNKKLGRKGVGDYRGQRVDNKEWIKGFYVYDYQHDTHLIFVNEVFDCPGVRPRTEEARRARYYSDCYEIIPGTLGRFTGLYDDTNWEDLTENKQKEFLSRQYIGPAGEYQKLTKEDWCGQEIWEWDVIRKKIKNKDGKILYSWRRVMFDENISQFYAEDEKTGERLSLFQKDQIVFHLSEIPPCFTPSEDYFDFPHCNGDGRKYCQFECELNCLPFV